MTPTFLYDPTSHCLREVAIETDNQCDCDACAEGRRAKYPVIQCSKGSVWPDGYLIEGKDFEIKKILFRSGPFSEMEPQAFPIVKQPRLYTQAEAEEIWRAGYDCGHAEAAREDYTDKQQYFKTRFDITIKE